MFQYNLPILKTNLISSSLWQFWDEKILDISCSPNVKKCIFFWVKNCNCSQNTLFLLSIIQKQSEKIRKNFVTLSTVNKLRNFFGGLFDGIFYIHSTVKIYFVSMKNYFKKYIFSTILIWMFSKIKTFHLAN